MVYKLQRTIKRNLRRTKSCRRSNTLSTMGSPKINRNITELPTEVLVLIFKNFSSSEVAKQLRLVCRRFSHVAALVLNSELSTLGRRIVRSMDAVEEHMKTAQTVSQLRALNRTFGLLILARSHVSSLSESSLRLLFSVSKLHILVIKIIKHTRNILLHKFSVLQILCC